MTIPVAVSAVESPRPKDVGVLAMEVYFPRRVSFYPYFSCLTTCIDSVLRGSASPKATLKTLTVFPKESIPLVLDKNTWLGQMTARTSILSP